MRPSSPFGCLLLIAAFTVACGSRSTLYAGSEATADGGGATTSTTTSSTSTASSTSTTSSTSSTSTASGGGGSGGVGGAGGAGGSSIDCSVLAIAGPPASLEGGFGYHQHRPVWTLSSDDGALVTLLSAWQPVEGPNGGSFPESVMHTSLQPWLDFPSGGALGPSDLANEEGGASFAAARAANGRFAMLFADSEPPEGGLLFGNDFVPFTTGPSAVDMVHPSAKEALFAAQGPLEGLIPVGHLVGMSIEGSSGGAYALRAGFASDTGAFIDGKDLGCASGPLHADAVGTTTGWLMAMSNGEAFGAPDCLDPKPGLGWPYQVQLVVAKYESWSFESTDSLGAPGGATELKMAPRSDGAWLVVGTPPGQVVNGTYLGARIDLDGKVLSTFQVGGGYPVQEIMVEGTLAAAGVADHLVVAWIDVAGDKGPFLRVKTFDPEGLAAGHVEIFPDTSFVGAPALLGSPLTGSVLLAWSETPDPGMGEGDTMRAVRIDCVGPP